MKPLFIVFLLYSICQSNIYSQPLNLDSLKLSLIDLDEDTIKIRTLLKITGELNHIDINEGLEYANRALQISEKIDHKRSEIKSLYMVAAGHFRLSNLDSCFHYLLKAEQLSINGQNNYQLDNIYNLIGIAYRNVGDYESATSYGFKSIKLFEIQNDIEGLAYGYNTLGSIYWDINDLNNAKKYYNRSLDYFIQINDSIQIANGLLSMFLVTKGKERLGYIERSTDIAISTNNQSLLPYIYSNFGSYFINDKIDYQKAIGYLQKGFKIATKNNDKYISGHLQNNIGFVFHKLGKLDSSIFYIKNALKISNESGDLQEIADGKFNLYEVYKSKSNIDSALSYLEAYSSLKDTLYNHNLLEEIQEANAKYESEKKDNEIALHQIEILNQEQDKNRILSAGLFIFLLLLGLFVWYRERQKRLKRETQFALESEQIEANKYKELDTMKNQFFTNITHELRTPLTLIMGPIDNALEKTEDNIVSKNLKLAKNNTDKLLDMINEILHLSKLENGEVKIDSDIVNINQFSRRVLFSFQSTADLKDIKFSYNSTIENEIGVLIDIEKVEIILNNLISNALKFSPINDTISVKVDFNSNYLVYTVSDNGIGIKNEEQEHIFNRFYQSKENLDVHGAGTGVGLALVKSLCNILKGTIEIESKFGQGSKFIVCIPASIEEIKQTEGHSNKSKIEPISYEPILINGEKPNILVIEDNNEMQQFLKDMLQDEYRVTIANDGYKGLQLIQTNSYDIVSCDIMMPNMNGFTLKEKTNELNLLKDIPFIFLTAKILDEDKLKGLRLGVDDYITKPFNKYAYKARINNLLQNKKSRIEFLSVNTDYAIQDMESVEYQLLKNAEKLVLKNISNAKLKVNDLAIELNYSQRQLARIIKKLTGMTSVQFILELRLQRAHHLIQSKSYTTISEVQYEIGIESASYFTRKFKERYGISPSEI